MITTPQKSKIEAVINVFETGKKEGKYDALVGAAVGKLHTGVVRPRNREITT